MPSFITFSSATSLEFKIDTSDSLNVGTYFMKVKLNMLTGTGSAYDGFSLSLRVMSPIPPTPPSATPPYFIEPLTTIFTIN